MTDVNLNINLTVNGHNARSGETNAKTCNKDEAAIFSFSAGTTEELQTEIAGLETRITALETELAVEQREEAIPAAAENVTIEEITDTDAAQLQAEIEALKAELSSTITALNTETERANAAEAENAQLETSLAAEEVENEALAGQVAGLTTDLAEETAENTALQAEKTTLETNLATEEAENEALIGQVAGLTADLTEETAENLVLTGQVTELTTDLAEETIRANTAEQTLEDNNLNNIFAKFYTTTTVTNDATDEVERYSKLNALGKYAAGIDGVLSLDEVLALDTDDNGILSNVEIDAAKTKMEETEEQTGMMQMFMMFMTMMMQMMGGNRNTNSTYTSGSYPVYNSAYNTNYGNYNSGTVSFSGANLSSSIASYLNRMGISV